MYTMIYTYKDREKVKSPFCFYDKTLELGTYLIEKKEIKSCEL